MIIKLRRLAIIFIIITSIIIYDVCKGVINPLLAFSGIFAGLFIGALVGRYSNIHWHEETSTVISKWDTITIVVLVVYLIFSFSKKWIFGHWIHGPSLSAFSLSLASGIISGRILSMRKQIRVILREKGILYSKP